MVLESLISLATAKKKPWETFLIGCLYATVGLFLALWVFPEYSSMIMVFLITLAGVPLLYFTINDEEEEDKKLPNERSILQEHFKVITFLMMFFFGTTVSLALWYVLLPTDTVSTIFSSQSATILTVKNNLSGGIFGSEVLQRIFLNNVRVLLFSVLFSFIYGVGSLFILVWNSTVIATAIGSFIRQGIANSSEAFGLGGGSYFHLLSFGFLRYALHGIPEILAYFIGGLAGGILSVAIIKHDIFAQGKEQVIIDATELLLLSIGVLFAAALIEVYITPMIF